MIQHTTVLSQPSSNPEGTMDSFIQRWLKKNSEWKAPSQGATHNQYLGLNKVAEQEPKQPSWAVSVFLAGYMRK